jgi:hypothetical protein
MNLTKRVTELEDRLKKLEDVLLKYQADLREHKAQTNYQLTKDARLARELGKKK